MSHAQVHDSIYVSAQDQPRTRLRRVLGAVRLDAEVWDEIVGDPAALGQASVVVVGAALASAFAARASGTTSAALLGALSTAAIWPIFTGLLWALAHVLGHPLRAGAALRIVGFSMAPLSLVALAAVPLAPFQMLVRLLALSLFFAALVSGTRQALRIDTMRAAFVCFLVLLSALFLSMLLVLLLASVL